MQSAIQSGDKLVGRVKFFEQARGYGFICVEGRPDIFFHITSVSTPNAKNLLTDGTPVLFSRVSSARGDQAKDVEIVESGD